MKKSHPTVAWLIRGQLDVEELDNESGEPLEEAEV
jgi:hypothetical protein